MASYSNFMPVNHHLGLFAPLHQYMADSLCALRRAAASTHDRTVLKQAFRKWTGVARVAPVQVSVVQIDSDSESEDERNDYFRDPESILWRAYGMNSSLLALVAFLFAMLTSFVQIDV